MQTLLEEKSKMENNFMADRKAMKADLDKVWRDTIMTKLKLFVHDGHVMNLISFGRAGPSLMV